jgi:large subunit ribosomal protein L25
MEMQIRVEPRTVTGKHTKRLRAAGVVPGVVFGKKAGSVPVQLDAKALDQLFREAGRTSVVRISVDGGETNSVVIKSIQRHPLTGRALHVDFFALDLTAEMTVDIPLVFVGEPPAVEATGGFLLTSLANLRVKALPSDLPHELTIDVTPLVDLESAIHVSDISVAENVTVLTDPDELVARVMSPRVEEEPEPVVAEGEEGVEGEEGAEGEEGVAGEEGAAEGGSGDEES